MSSDLLRRQDKEAGASPCAETPTCVKSSTNPKRGKHFGGVDAAEGTTTLIIEKLATNKGSQ